MITMQQVTSFLNQYQNDTVMGKTTVTFKDPDPYLASNITQAMVDGYRNGFLLSSEVEYKDGHMCVSFEIRPANMNPGDEVAPVQLE